ncbi:ABC transporter substrate-binding protein [Alicyclobacillus shizuokensis]|uniref:ABC transporter substrate-binding protein n=1 Tax=Alicyclobacillus shizuokensis TaxID=392014 RepID=UPI001C3F29E9|nr:ABC transporter substrate-binding protein [Alicyclobacillus shizuokensis]
MDNLIKEFEKSHPNIKIERTPVPYEQLLPKSLQEATTHTLPTILVTDNLNIPTMVSAGAITPLSRFGEVDTSQYLDGPLSTVTYDGEIYGLPLGTNDLALFYNKSLLAKAHVSPPKTWDELLNVAKKLKSSSTYGLAFSAPKDEQATWQFAPFLWTNGGNYTHFDSPQAIQALELWTNLVKTGGASKSVVNFSQNEVYNEFAAGRAAMMVMGPWEVPPLKQTKIDYGVVPLPTPKAGQTPISPIGGEDWTITSSATPEQQKAAWTFLQWTQQKDTLEKFDEAMGYIPALKSALTDFQQKNKDYAVFAKQLESSRALTSGLRDKLPNVTDAVTTAIQQALTGEQTPAQAAHQAESQIKSILG